MLVLSRTHGQRIIVGENIVVTVLSTAGNRVRIGIQAPDSVDVVREEVLWNPIKRSAGRRLKEHA